jgi:hypothetical protein
MKMIGISSGGKNEIKYPKRNNHGSRPDFIHPERNEIIKRGIARITRMIGLRIKCFCLSNCSRKYCLYDCFLRAFECVLAVLIIITIAEIRLIENGIIK